MGAADTLVEALSNMSPLARTKIRATLEDTSQEVTWNNWTQVFDMHDLDSEEHEACGCLMVDGYLKEHPPVFVLIDLGEYEYCVVDPDWESVLAVFYEMEDDEWSDAVDRVRTTATAYDQYVKHNEQLVKRVRGVEVLRTPARRALVKLVDKAEARAKAKAVPGA